MAAQVAATEAEDGCIAYRFSVDVTDPDLLHISERWRDQAALTAHFTAPHMATFNAALAQAQPLSIDVVAHDAPAGPRPLAG